MNSALRNLVTDSFKLFILISALIALVCSKEFMQSFRYLKSEYWAIFLMCLLGMFIAVSSTNLLVVFIGLELMALAFYTLIALDKNNPNAISAALKYFILGSLASGILLFGFSLVYGAIGSFDLIEIMQGTREITNVLAQNVQSQNLNGSNDFLFFVQKTELLLSVGVIFIIIALAFKLGAVPFHLWVADVYDGAHTPIVTLIASASKIVATAVVFRLLIMGFYPLFETWSPLILFLALASIVLGNVAAIVQKSVKRMLAYSSIAHAGFLLLGFVSGTLESIGAAIFYIFSYALTSALAFGLLSSISHPKENFDTVNSLKGLHTRRPIFALIMMILMFSMSGIPPLLGFYAKFGIIQSLVNTDMLGVAIFAVIFSVIGAYYYLRVIKVMYFDTPKQRGNIRKISLESLIVLVLGSALVVYFGLFPDALLSLTRFSLFLEQSLPKVLFSF